MILGNDVEMVRDPVPQWNAYADMTKYDALGCISW
jgi:hypothetical protein